LLSDPAGIRTQDPNIKSVMLYQLSYGIILFNFAALLPAPFIAIQLWLKIRKAFFQRLFVIPLGLFVILFGNYYMLSDA
jgi:hypothetical protein